MTGQIIANGTAAFSPIVDKLGAIATEFLPYMIYVAIACLGVALAFKALNYIIGYTRNKTKSIFYYRDIDFKQLGRDKNGYNTLQVTRTRKRKRRPNRSKLRN